MEIFSLDLLFDDDILAIELSQLRDVVEHLQAVVFAILDGVEAEIKLCDLWQILNVLQLHDLVDLVEADVKKPKRLGHLESLQHLNLVLTQVERLKHFEPVQALDHLNCISGQVQFL